MEPQNFRIMTQSNLMGQLSYFEDDANRELVDPKTKRVVKPPTEDISKMNI